MLLQRSHPNSHNRIDENWSSEDTRRAEEGDELFSPPKGTFWRLQEFVGSLDAVLGTRSSVDLLSYCVDLLSHSANRLFWELIQCRPALVVVSTCCPNSENSVDLLSYCVDLLSHSANRLFWELIQCRPALVVVSTCCPNSENKLFWERGPVSTCPYPVSTWVD
ncbi:hypothetical protein Taro_019856 [Colocasia esculenta]|uniref:Uncharacterized protein n=1 Tax=Colocasia esculenta TaxID=4460 RepID=A0A843V6S2_COLES|nr:hypothetical protein [Colocasia esculenta]